ncbi:unnamed protein product [Echinostoma caproni]|uniref:Uncharacterized protein n=1 Tax=Echinostoma caproni TaxID=27848 RepID=A0A183AJ03_9TREM|nr:unnamed protein product [Echinostoma caproni]
MIDITRDSGHSNDDPRLLATEGGPYGPSRPSRSRYIESHPVEDDIRRGPVSLQNVRGAPFANPQWPDNPPLGMPSRPAIGQPAPIGPRFGTTEAQVEMTRGRLDPSAEQGRTWPSGQRNLPEQNRQGQVGRQRGK